jgi:hypothetical protein
MFSRSTIVVLGTVLGTLVWVFLRDSALALAIESAMEAVARNFGISKPEMITAASPFVFALLAGWAVAWSAYGIGLRDRIQKSPLVIEYRWNDPRHVEPVPSVTGGVGTTRYYVEVFNRSTSKTVQDVVVDWDQTPFTRFIDQEVRRDGLDSFAALHPLERRRVYLFGITDQITTVQNWKDVLGHTSFFTVRARGKDAPEVFQQFEYSPVHFPKVLRV